jgi:catechol 2,3-dioxygenase-like lactoylglutathione lyase family enzyme
LSTHAGAPNSPYLLPGPSMSVALHHTIVAGRDTQRSTQFLAGVLGLEAPHPVSHFIALELANGVTLDFAAASEVRPPHDAFLLGSDFELDAVFERLASTGVTHYADPNHNGPGVVNQRKGGQGSYSEDPNGHNMEVFTKPSGKVVRHRLNRGGNRSANCALWRIVLVRLKNDARTRAYYDRRSDEGLTSREIIRCLKRYVARDVYAAITADLGGPSAGPADAAPLQGFRPGEAAA